MRTGFRLLGILLAAVLTVVPGFAAENVPTPLHNAILIGWDGVQRDHLKECLGRDELPHLKQLIAEGAIMAIDVTTGATDTKAGWAQILTGYNPERTGVFSNSRYQPIPEGYTIFERLQAAFGRENIVTVMLAGKSNNLGARGPHTIAPTRAAQAARTAAAEADMEKHEITEVKPTAAPKQSTSGGLAGEPYFITHRKLDVFENGLGAADNVGNRALSFLEKYRDRRFFFFIHFQEPDPEGHRAGENSREYNDAIITDDLWLGRIVAKLKQLNLYDRTRIYVVSDHGFDEGQKTHRHAPHVFLATNDPEVAAAGDRKDVVPTILWRFGVVLDQIQPPLDGKPLRRTATGGAPIW